MTTITRTFETQENFWQINPSFLTIKSFREFNKSDKSKNKSNSSQVMWAIAFLIDPHTDNPWKNLGEQDKRDLIKNDYLDIDWDQHQNLIDEYYSRCLTPAERNLFDIIEKMNERAKFIKNTEYSLDQYEEMDGRSKLVKGTAVQLDKMVVDTKKIYDQLEQVQQMVAKEKSDGGKTKGGMQESAAEQGLL
jgi:hypothetical protein|tara:strand:+ start:9827 stop:10399 length:573 start_codon:yes stop_codon:yes gene_type:complete